MNFTDEERRIVEDWLKDPQINLFSRAAAEVIARLLRKETT